MDVVLDISQLNYFSFFFHITSLIGFLIFFFSHSLPHLYTFPFPLSLYHSLSLLPPPPHLPLSQPKLKVGFAHGEQIAQCEYIKLVLDQSSVQIVGGKIQEICSQGVYGAVHKEEVGREDVSVFIL